jgi:DNA-binding transcriptional LysR family regulator
MDHLRLDLYLVEIFCCVYEHGNFSKAAKKLRISQPTISGHIKNLEDHVGLKLFDRLPKRVVPTRAGELLYKHGCLILKEKESAIRGLNKLRNCVEGPLLIHSSTTPGEYMLPKIIASFHNEYPGIAIEMRISDSKITCDEVLKGKAEIGIVGAMFESKELDFRHLASDQMVLVAPNNDRWRNVKSITLSALVKEPFLVREAGSGSRIAFETEAGINLDDFNIVGCLGSTSAIKEALRANLGVSVLSLLSVKNEIDGGLFKAVTIDGMDTIERELYTVVNKSFTLSPIAESFLRLLETGESLKKDNGRSGTVGLGKPLKPVESRHTNQVGLTSAKPLNLVEGDRNSSWQKAG